LQRLAAVVEFFLMPSSNFQQYEKSYPAPNADLGGERGAVTG